MTRSVSSREAGFTLIEVMISLALFALISMAGIALVDSIIRVEERSSGRIERLGQLQRAMFLLARDLEQLSSGSLRQIEGGISFDRHGASLFEGDIRVAYAIRDGSLFRIVGAEGASMMDQLLLPGVQSVNWSFFLPEAGWQNVLPVTQGQELPDQPNAVAVDIALDPASSPSGSLRRVVELPTPPPPPPQQAPFVP